MCRYSPWIGTNHSGRAIDRYVFSSSAWAWPVACTSAMPLWITSHAGAQQAVDDPVDVALVAGDGVARQDDRVVLADLDPLVLAARQQRQRRHRLALRTGGDDAHLAGRVLVDVLDVDQRRVGDLQDAEVAAHAHVLLHAQPERRDDPPGGDRRVGDLLDAVQVAGEAGGDDPPAGLLGEQLPQHRRRRWSRSARGRAPRRWCESAISRRMPSVDAIAPMRPRSVRRPSTGVRSSLKSPECRITPCGVCNAMAWACGTRVGDGDELDVERADHAAARRRARRSARCDRAGPPPRCGCGPGRA